jgi:hypothetical protein
MVPVFGWFWFLPLNVVSRGRRNDVIEVCYGDTVAALSHANRQKFFMPIGA